MSKKLFVTAGASKAIAARLLGEAGVEPGEVHSKLFKDGEVYHRLPAPVANHESVLVGSFATPDSTLELFDVASLLAEERTQKLTIVVESDGSKRGSRWTQFLARMRNRLLTAIPQTAGGNFIVEVDAGGKSVPLSKTIPERLASRRRKGKPSTDLFSHGGKAVIFATRSYGFMLDNFAATGQFEVGELERDDETGQVKLQTDVRGRNVIILGGTIDHAETLDYYALANLVYEAEAISQTFICFYFGYSTMERGKAGLHEAVKAKYRARLISSVPRCPLGNYVVMLDLHSEGIPSYFEHGVGTTHCYAIKDVLLKSLINGRTNGRLCSTDAGRAKWVNSLSDDIGNGWRPAFAFKDRKDDVEETELIGVMGDVEGFDLDLFDDMLRTGTSARDAGCAYRKKGCLGIKLIIAHGVLPGSAHDGMMAAVDEEGVKLFDEIVCLDTHPRAVALAGDFLKVKPCRDIVIAHLATELPMLVPETVLAG